MIRSSANEVDDGFVVGERVGHIVSAHVLCHVNSDVNSGDLQMYHVAVYRRALDEWRCLV
jgi:hypothetical protein